MNTFSEQLKSNIADIRYDTYLKIKNGFSGQNITLFLSHSIDSIIQNVIQKIQTAHSIPNDLDKKFVLCALGSYGRKELCPYSDIDVMFLYDKSSKGKLKNIAKDFFHIFFDAGLDIGHSFRSISECIELAKNDSESFTSILDARVIFGNEKIFTDFLKSIKHLIKKHKYKFIEQKINERNIRHLKYKSTVYFQEPDIKDGVGGLRDYHFSHWLLNVGYGIQNNIVGESPTTCDKSHCYGTYGIQNIADERSNRSDRTLCLSYEKHLIENAILLEDEYLRVIEAVDFLLKTRSALHSITNTKCDILSFENQENIANHLSYSSTENFMISYYRSTRELMHLSERIQERFAKKRHKLFISFSQNINCGDDFILKASQICPAISENKIFIDSPHKLLKVFHIAQKYSASFSECIERAIIKNLPLIDDTLRNSADMGKIFMSILKHINGTSYILRKMHELGVLDVYIPEFRDIDCLIPRDMYHEYTIDEHLIRTVENIEYLASISKENIARQSSNILPSSLSAEKNFSHIFYEIEKPEILILSALLHDIGKNSPENHLDKGAELSKNIAKRIGLFDKDIETLTFLVKNHLAISNIFQRREYFDSSVKETIWKIVEHKDNLNMLTLLTYADIKAVGDKVWTEWKGELLWQFYVETLQELDKNVEDTLVSSEKTLLSNKKPAHSENDNLATTKVHLLKNITKKILLSIPDNISSAFAEDFLNTMPKRYLLSFSTDDIVEHIILKQKLDRLCENTDFQKFCRAWYPHHAVLGRYENPFLQENNENPAPFDSRDFPVPAIPLVTKLQHFEDHSKITICTKDMPFLFSKICGVLSASYLNIYRAQAFTSTDNVAPACALHADRCKRDLAIKVEPASCLFNKMTHPYPSQEGNYKVEQASCLFNKTHKQIALDVFYVFEDELFKNFNKEEIWTKVTQQLSSVISNKITVDELIEKSRKNLFSKKSKRKNIQSNITFDNKTSDKFTIIDIFGQDRIGLLYDISSTISRLGFDIHIARISTEGEEIADAFYVTDSDDKKIDDKKNEEEIKGKILEAMLKF